MMYRGLVAISGLYLTLLSATQSYPVFAQEPEVRSRDEADTASVVVYDAEYFAPYNPITAEDMINRIPGAEGLVGGFGNDQEERRGLRSNTDQILIDGKRLTGKENQSSSFLERLPAKSVERIELITGNVRELDTDVGVRVINVVLKEGAGRGSGVAQAGVFYFPSDQYRPMGTLSYSGTAGQIDYNGSLSLRPGLTPTDVVDVLVDSAGNRIALIQEERRQDQSQIEARGSITYSGEANQVFQLNGLINHFPRDNQDTTVSFVDPGDGSLLNTGTFIDNIRGDDTTWEISGDYAQPLSKKVNFTGLFIYSRSTTDRNNENFDILSDVEVPTGSDAREQTSTEKILRGTFNWKMAEKHDLEVGVEGAINTLDKDLDFSVIVDGVPVNVPIINSDQKITEDRVEAFSTHSWKPINGIEIETGLAAEFSWLTQIGSDVSSERSLKFVKPSLDIWYNPTQASQVWFSFRRDVGQLDFDDFVATVNREDNEVLAGNPDLVPEKSWDFEVGAEHRLANGAGVINGRVFYRRINDVKDLIPLGLDDSQPGNLGNGSHYGAEFESSIRFARFTDADVVLSGSVLVQDSRVTDPFTGQKRKIGNLKDYELKLEGRHDIQDWGLSYGFDVTKNGPTIESDFNEFDRKTTSLDARIFFEKTLRAGTILRVFWANLLEVNTRRERTIFNPSQANGVVERTEFRDEERGYIAGFRLRTTF